MFFGHPRSRRTGLDGRIIVEVVTYCPPGITEVAEGDHLGLDGCEPRWFVVVKTGEPPSPGRLLLLLRESSYPERLAWDVMTA